MRPRWSTRDTAFAFWVIELPDPTLEDPATRTTFVRGVLEAGSDTGVYALGDAAGPDTGIADAWLSRLSREPAPWFPDRGPLGLAPDSPRPWTRLRPHDGAAPRWISDLGRLREELDPGTRATHVPPVALSGPHAGVPEISVTLYSDLWFPRVLDLDGEDDDKAPSWVPQGEAARDGARRFNAFLARVSAAAEALGGEVWLDEPGGIGANYAALVSDLGLTTRD